MESDSSDDSVIVMWSYLKSKKKKRKFWIHPYLANNINRNEYVSSRELLLHPERIKSFYRMSKESFSELCNLLEPAIS